MSWQAHTWTRNKSKDYELPPTARLVLRSLADFADKNGDNIYPSLATLEDETGLSERTIRRCIKHLIEIGLLEYGDQSVVADNPRYRNDQLPKVYRFVFTRDAAGQLDFAAFGRMPAKSKPWQRKPKPKRQDVIQPVEKPDPVPVETAERPDSDDATTGQTGGHKVHQTVKSIKDNPLKDPAPAWIDFAAIRSLREASRARLAKRGIHITAPLVSAPPAQAMVNAL